MGRRLRRTSVFANGENLGAGAIHLPRACEIISRGPHEIPDFVGISQAAGGTEHRVHQEGGGRGGVTAFSPDRQKNVENPAESSRLRRVFASLHSARTIHHKRQGFSAAWHRRRPGGPGRYSAAAIKACGVIPMRAAPGAAAPVTQVNTGPPPKPSEAGSVGRGGAVEGVSFAACGEANDLKLAPTTGGNARPVLAGQLQPTAALDPGSRARRPWWFSHRF